MRRTIGVFVLLTLVAGGILGFYKVSSRPRTPDQVVRRSYEYLRQGDLRRLERCYTAAAWAQMQTVLPADGDREALDNFKRYMDRLGNVKVTSSVVTGVTADVETLVQHDGETQHERFHLVLNAGRWCID